MVTSSNKPSHIETDLGVIIGKLGNKSNCRYIVTDLCFIYVSFNHCSLKCYTIKVLHFFSKITVVSYLLVWKVSFVQLNTFQNLHKQQILSEPVLGSLSLDMPFIKYRMVFIYLFKDFIEADLIWL